MSHWCTFLFFMAIWWKPPVDDPTASGIPDKSSDELDLQVRFSAEINEFVSHCFDGFSSLSCINSQYVTNVYSYETVKWSSFSSIKITFI